MGTDISGNHLSSGGPHAVRVTQGQLERAAMLADGETLWLDDVTTPAADGHWHELALTRVEAELLLAGETATQLLGKTRPDALPEQDHTHMVTLIPC
jgi:hypothetical protein